MTTAILQQQEGSPSSSTAAVGFDFGPDPPPFPSIEAERQFLKQRLAGAFRLIAMHGMMEPGNASGHFTVRDPEHKDCFWVNPYGRHFSLMRASDLLLINHKGDIIGGGAPGRYPILNTAAFVIHSAIHLARPSINAIFHAHTPAGKPFSTLSRPLPLYTQDSTVFWNDQALYDSFGGVVLGEDEGANIVKALGRKKVCVLKNHGILSVGETVESALCWFMMLENECAGVLKAEASAAYTGIAPQVVGDAVAEFTYRETGSEKAGWFETQSLYEILDEKEPDYKL